MFTNLTQITTLLATPIQRTSQHRLSCFAAIKYGAELNLRDTSQVYAQSPSTVQQYIAQGARRAYIAFACYIEASFDLSVAAQLNAGVKRGTIAWHQPPTDYLYELQFAIPVPLQTRYDPGKATDDRGHVSPPSILEKTHRRSTMD